MGYPVAYRSAAQPAGGGFQNPSPKPLSAPVMPSNDNFPRPANDNVKDAIRAANEVRKLLRWWKWMNPWVGAALTAWDIYEWYRASQGQEAQAAGWDLTGWEKTSSCGPAQGPYFYPGVGGSCGADAHSISERGQVWAQPSQTLPSGYVGPTWALLFMNAEGQYPSIYGIDQGLRSDAYAKPRVEGDPAGANAPQWLEEQPWGYAAWITRPDAEPYGPPVPDYMPAANPVPGHKPGTAVPPPKPLPVWSIPYRAPNPYVSPTEQPHWGPQPEPAPWQVPKFRPHPAPRPGPRPRTRPRNDPRYEPFIPPRVNSQDPEPTLVEVMQPGYKNQYAYQSHRYRKPGPRVKEKKLYDAKGVWRLYKLLGHATEVSDFVDAFWNALPKKYRKPKPDGPISLSEKLWIIWTHWDEIDQWEAMKNYLDNAQEDEVVGFFHGAGAQGAVGVGATPLGPAI